MADKDADVPDLWAGEEGISTLAAQFTRKSVERIVGIIRRERARGVSEAALAKAMERDLGDYDEHSRKLLLRLGSGGGVADDFPSDAVTESKKPKPNTVVLTLTTAPAGVQLHSIVRYSCQEWLVSEVEGNNWTLKLLQ